MLCAAVRSCMVYKKRGSYIKTTLRNKNTENDSNEIQMSCSGQNQREKEITEQYRRNLGDYFASSIAVLELQRSKPKIAHSRSYIWAVKHDRQLE